MWGHGLFWLEAPCRWSSFSKPERGTNRSADSHRCWLCLIAMGAHGIWFGETVSTSMRKSCCSSTFCLPESTRIQLARNATGSIQSQVIATCITDIRTHIVQYLAARGQ